MSFYGLLLSPFALLYGFITWCRNKFFDWGILIQKQHAIPIISVGNLSMGGTGKTPLIEHLIRLLKEDFKLATLSRGYGRKTKGFILADINATAITIGDESMQYYQKFENIVVAVCENRNLGVKKLMKAVPDLDLILLDDAFQHRYIKAGLSILLTDFYKLYTDDHMFPSGSLREFSCGAKRADIVIVTKTPVVLSPITRSRIEGELNLTKNQILLFSKVVSKVLTPVFPSNKWNLKKHYSNIVLFSGIANNYPLQEYLRQFCSDLTVLTFPDHHVYSEKDIYRILKAYEDIFSKNKIVVTTEKDVMRLIDCNRVSLIKGIPFFYVPISITFHDVDEKILKRKVENYLAMSERHSKKA